MNYKFDIQSQEKSKIKVIGVGGGGSNAVNYMYEQGILGVEFLICNTDAQAIKLSPVPSKIQIGSEGLGAGNNPEKGKLLAIEDKEKLREALQDTNMVFINAGMGGGTGTGAAPIVAKFAKELDILTVGIVTMPFSFEGKRKREIAEAGVREFKNHCDTVIVILNDKIREIYGNLNLKQAFSQADEILTKASKSIAEIITNPGYINIDFNDVKMVMSEAGTAVMGSSTQEGPDRAIKAAEGALNSPLLNNTDIKGATKILVSIIVSEASAMDMDEFGAINEYFQDMAGHDALLKVGVSIDPNLGDSLTVTVIATGFEKELLNNENIGEPVKTVINLETNKNISSNQTSKGNDFGNFSQENAPKQEPIKIIETQNGVFSKSEEKIEIARDYTKNQYQAVPNQVANQNYSMPQQASLFDDPSKERVVYIDQQKINEDQHKEMMIRAYREREQRLSNQVTSSSMKPDDFKERLEVPAYLRMGKTLQEVPHSSDRVVSRFNLNEDNELLGNNKFLHDNVD